MRGEQGDLRDHQRLLHDLEAGAARSPGAGGQRSGSFSVHAPPSRPACRRRCDVRRPLARRAGSPAGSKSPAAWSAPVAVKSGCAAAQACSGSWVSTARDTTRVVVRAQLRRVHAQDAAPRCWPCRRLRNSTTRSTVSPGLGRRAPRLRGPCEPRPRSRSGRSASRSTTTAPASSTMRFGDQESQPLVPGSCPGRAHGDALRADVVEPRSRAVPRRRRARSRALRVRRAPCARAELLATAEPPCAEHSLPGSRFLRRVLALDHSVRSVASSSCRGRSGLVA